MVPAGAQHVHDGAGHHVVLVPLLDDEAQPRRGGQQDLAELPDRGDVDLLRRDGGGSRRSWVIWCATSRVPAASRPDTTLDPRVGWNRASRPIGPGPWCADPPRVARHGCGAGALTKVCGDDTSRGPRPPLRWLLRLPRRGEGSPDALDDVHQIIGTERQARQLVGRGR